MLPYLFGPKAEVTLYGNIGETPIRKRMFITEFSAEVGLDDRTSLGTAWMRPRSAQRDTSSR